MTGAAGRSVHCQVHPDLLPPSNLPPAYCCAILLDRAGRLLLERRPSDDADAPGRLTCFGGGREAGEDPLLCLRRELAEEIGFAVGIASHVLTLHTPAGPAWFYVAEGPPPGTVRAHEPGHEAVWLERAALLTAPLADWHDAALRAWHSGEPEAWVAGMRPREWWARKNSRPG